MPSAIVVPPFSILAEPPVVVADAVVDKRGTRQVAQASTGHSSPTRPISRFPEIRLVGVDQAFGGWAKAQAEHFADGAAFDQIYKPGRPVTR
jgi:ABC-type sulfate transport system substrate-binding protein